MPNLFNYATSELSQDAFLAWLIQWADIDCKKIDSYLNACAVSFVQEILGKESSYKIETVKSGRQWNNIDVWALVNNKYFLVIEDKKGTKEHSNQLVRYAEISKKHYENTNIEIVLLYFKMQEQSNFTFIKNSGFEIYTRNKMLCILDNYYNTVPTTNQNNILIDYYTNLKELNSKINSYTSLPLNKWEDYSWQGFYSNLQNYINGEWNYVSNKGGGFLGFWWHHKRIKIKELDIEFYLQLEQEKLTFKLISFNDSTRRLSRDFYRKFLFKKANELNVSISRFGRLGKHMGVAKLSYEYRLTDENGIFDLGATVDNLIGLMKLIDETEKEITAHNTV